MGSYGFSRRRMRTVVECIWGKKFQVTGTENIPRSDSAVLAANQTTHLDPLFLALAVRRPIHFVGLDDHGELEPWYTPLLYEMMGVIHLTGNLAQHGGREFLSEVDDAVRYRELIGIFPEGRLELKRDRTQIAPFHRGALVIGRRYHIPIVPVLMEGMEEVMPNSTAHLRERVHVAPIRVVVGRPMDALDEDERCLREAILQLKYGCGPSQANAWEDRRNGLHHLAS